MTDRPVACFRLHVVIGSRRSVATKATLYRPGELPANFLHRKNAERSIGPHRIVRGWRSLVDAAAIREHRHHDVFQIRRRSGVREAETPGEVAAGVDKVGGREDAEMAVRSPTADRNFHVGGHRAVVLADARDSGHVVVAIGDDRRPLNGQEVAEAKRRETGNEFDPEDVAVLDFDIEARRREDVGRDEVEIMEVADAEAWNDVAIGRQADRTAGSGNVQSLGAGGVGRSRGDEHHHRRRPVIRHDHLPDGKLDEADVGEIVPVAVSLEKAGAGQEATASMVDQNGLADGVGERLLGLGAIGTEALALAGRRRTHGVVQSRSRVNRLFHFEVCVQLIEAVRRSDVNLSRNTRLTFNGSGNYIKGKGIF